MDVRDEIRLALEVPRWAWRFCLRHLPLVTGLSLVGSAQRLVVVTWGEQLPGALAAASEVLVTGTRVLLLVLVWRLAMRDTPWRWANLPVFARRHWRGLLVQGALLTVAFLVFDVVAEHVVGALLPREARSAYLGVLLFVKNPTVIAYTFVWWVGIVRQMVANTPRPTPATV